MTTTQMVDTMKNRKVMLSSLWTFAMFNYLYADVIGLMQTESLEAFLAGSLGSFQLTDGFFLGAAILMETSIAMVLLSRVLKYHANRWANIFTGALHTAAVLGSMFVGTGVEPYYLMFGVIEVACTLFIIWYAWTWPAPEDTYQEKPIS